MADPHDQTLPVSPVQGPGNRASLRTVAAACGLAGVFFVAVFIGRSLKHRRTPPAFEQVSVAERRAVADGKAGHLDRGEMVFQVYCAKCHGPDGHGDAEAMVVQKPPPRDFAARPWRFEVTTDSIRRVTREGISGTAMPAHQAALATADLEAVAAHVYQLAMRGPEVVPRRSPLEQAITEAGFTLENTPSAAPHLPLVDAAGSTHSLADERGRVVLLQFWGLSCEHCLQGMPRLQALADRWQSRGLTVLSVCADAETAAEAQQAVAQVSPATRVWTDESGLANERFGVRVLPTLWLIDSTGRMLAAAQGMIDWNSTKVARMIEVVTDSWWSDADSGEKTSARRE